MDITNATGTLRMRDEVYVACARYLERLGAAEYRAHLAARKRKTDRYTPSAYHSELVRLLSERDEVAFKALKALQGYASALGC